MKDNFSTKSANYKAYRPGYPTEIFDLIKENLTSFEKAWDCGAGNGQIANEIATFFKQVEATDISGNQIANAVKKNNIHYSVQPAEETNFNNNVFDLVISAQAVHWFDFERFYAEIRRCLKPDGLVIIMGYGLFRSNSAAKDVITKFYNETIGSYWDPERKYLDDKYQTIPFPFKEQKTLEFEQKYNWDIEHLLGYLRTWSAVKHYERENNQDPVSLIENDLRESFGRKNKITFPVFVKMGKIE